MSSLQESTDQRATRLGQNEGLFRAVNREIANISKTFATGVVNQEFSIVCECGEMSCTQQIPIHTLEYLRVRSDPALFLLVPGHHDPTVELVMEELQDYVVVRKPPGSPAGLAADSMTAD